MVNQREISHSCPNLLVRMSPLAVLDEDMKLRRNKADLSLHDLRLAAHRREGEALRKHGQALLAANTPTNSDAMSSDSEEVLSGCERVVKAVSYDPYGLSHSPSFHL
eukprot:Pgem_evm1s20199